MANPNPEVWGAPNTWIDDQILYTSGYTGTTELKNIKPKTANFSPDMPVTNRNGNIIRGINQAGVFEWRTPIDETICPCGQDPTVSAYGKIDVYHNKKNIDQNKIPDYQNVYENENINWFFCSLQGVNQLLRYNQIDIDSPIQQWVPDGVELAPVEQHTEYNTNQYITPWVYYQTKSLLLRIKVLPINGQYAQNTTETNGAISLDDWKNNHSDKKISGVFLEILGCSEYNSQNNIIAYTGPLQGGYNFRTCVGFSLLNAVNNGRNEIIDYATFNYNQNNFIPLVSRYVRGNGFRSNEWTYIFGHHNLDNCELKFYYSEYADDGYGIYPEIGYSEHNYNQIMKMAACFGVPFTPTNKSSFNILFTDNDLYLPVIDENGVTHGEYTHGNDNLTNDLYTKGSIREYDYDPTRPPKPVDPNTYSNVTGFNSITTNAALTKRYVLDAANVEKLADDLWTICSELSSTDFEHFEGKLKDEFLTQNPIDCIISLQRFPFQIPSLITTKAPIRLGKSEGSAKGYTTFDMFNTILFSGKQIWPRFGNCFLDYEPYTSYEIYVPFCGTRKLRAEDLIGHTLNVQMQIDLITGSCTAYIMADELVIETLNGSCAVDQQLSGAQTATMNANIFNGILAQKETDKIEGMNIAKTWLPGNWVSDLMDPMGNAMRMSNAKYEAQKANYDITHVQVPPHKIGAASPLLGWYQEFDARIIIYYPEGDVINSTIPPTLNEGALATFGHLKGFGTVSPGTVSQFRGDLSRSWYLQGDIIADGIPCTDSERKRIKSMFAAGVYI